MALTEDQVNFVDMTLFDQSFAEQFDRLVAGKPAWCAKKNADVPVGDARLPDTVVIDVSFTAPLFECLQANCLQSRWLGSSYSMSARFSHRRRFIAGR